jgi:hypothetical protein
MPKPIEVVALLSSTAMMARKAESYTPETHVIDLTELRRLYFEMQQDSEREADGATTGVAALHNKCRIQTG